MYNNHGAYKNIQVMWCPDNFVYKNWQKFQIQNNNTFAYMQWSKTNVKISHWGKQNSYGYLKQARALPDSVDASDRSRLEEDTQVCNFWHTYSYYR